MENDTVKKSVNLLGFRAMDKVTGYRGTVTSVCFDLYGCIQACITPNVTADNKLEEGKWFDTNRLSVGERGSMDRPDFLNDKHGSEPSRPARC